MFFFYLLSGMFLGWSLGANDAANVYGTAVGTRMIRFATAATLCSLFVLVGAVLGGAGAAHTLGRLGTVNALPGSFTVALAAALTVTWMTRLGLPVSTSQAIVGAIIGWNLFAGALTDFGALTSIISSWVICPLLSAVFAVALMKLTQWLLHRARLHLLVQDTLTRNGLIVVGAFAAYSLGANNIANVMGVFVPAAPFGPLEIPGGLTLDPAQQLFLLGAVAIGVGVFTYSKRVMLTVGNDLFRMSATGALIVVAAQALVLFLFSSEELESWLITRGLPSIPLVPVSSSQAVIGAVAGIGLARGGRNIRFRTLGRIASGWVSTPLMAGLTSFVLLFFVQNVFSQQVSAPVRYAITREVAVKLKQRGLYDEHLGRLLDKRFNRATALKDALAPLLPPGLSAREVVELSEVWPLKVDIELLAHHFDYAWYTEEQLAAVFRLHGRRFDHTWQLDDALAAISPHWKPRPPTRRNKPYNKQLRTKLEYLHHLFKVDLPR
jgi:PiT family inorganic phosphate transporter